METKFLLEDESILTQSNDNSVVLTNRRILKNMYLKGNAYFISMHLQNISTIEIHSKSFPLLLIFGIISVVAGTVTAMRAREDGLFILGLALGFILILLYLLTRYHVVNVTSNGGSRLYFRTKGMKRESVLDFVRKIDQAKIQAK